MGMKEERGWGDGGWWCRDRCTIPFLYYRREINFRKARYVTVRKQT